MVFDIFYSFKGMRHKSNIQAKVIQPFYSYIYLMLNKILSYCSA